MKERRAPKHELKFYLILSKSPIGIQTDIYSTEDTILAGEQIAHPGGLVTAASFSVGLVAFFFLLRAQPSL